MQLQTINLPRAAQLPDGWTPIKYAQSKDHPRHAVVLCQRSGNDVADQDYVCWNVNTKEGGCHNGVYGSRGHAGNSYADRRLRLGEYTEVCL